MKKNLEKQLGDILKLENNKYIKKLGLERYIKYEKYKIQEKWHEIEIQLNENITKPSKKTSEKTEAYRTNLKNLKYDIRKIDEEKSGHEKMMKFALMVLLTMATAVKEKKSIKSAFSDRKAKNENVKNGVFQNCQYLLSLVIYGFLFGCYFMYTYMKKSEPSDLAQENKNLKQKLASLEKFTQQTIFEYEEQIDQFKEELGIETDEDSDEDSEEIKPKEKTVYQLQ